MRNFIVSILGCAALFLTATACSSTVELQADYPAYDQSSLVDGATLIAEGVVVATESTVLMPRYEGDDPEENPLAGLSEKEMREAIESAEGVPATAVTLRVENVYVGSVSDGQEVTIVQTGGEIDGVTYHVAGEDILTVEDRYLLFAADSFDGAYYILGGSAGTYRYDGDDRFVAVNPDMAPFEELSSSVVASLTG